MLRKLRKLSSDARMSMLSLAVLSFEHSASVIILLAAVFPLATFPILVCLFHLHGGQPLSLVHPFQQ